MGHDDIKFSSRWIHIQYRELKKRILLYSVISSGFCLQILYIDLEFLPNANTIFRQNTFILNWMVKELNTVEEVFVIYGNSDKRSGFT